MLGAQHARRAGPESSLSARTPIVCAPENAQPGRPELSASRLYAKEARAEACKQGPRTWRSVKCANKFSAGAPKRTTLPPSPYFLNRFI